jgi:hypothetical protein
MYQKDIEVVLREHRLPSTVPTNSNIPLGDLGRNSINNPISSDDSFMVLGGYEEEKSRDLYVMMAVSKDNSLMVGGHWGGTGQHRHVQPKSSGQSVMILGNVKGSATVEEIDQKFQRLQKPVKRTS